MGQKHVYDFDEGRVELKPLLGGKGANLAEMASIGIPVPPGFTISTAACVFFSRNQAYPEGLDREIGEHLAGLEEQMGKKLGDSGDPLLVSVRSGAVVSMPGMMDTVLNLGLNDESCAGLAAITGNDRFSWDSYRRFIQMFADVVMGVDSQLFEDELRRTKLEAGVENDTDLTGADLQDLVERYKRILRENARRDFPQDPREQLDMAIQAVFKSWDNPRAKYYRKLNDIADDLGTAVTVQSMVFGNKGETSGTGVAFTRNPSTGDNEFYGEFLMNAQGEDVVAGVRHPRPLPEMRQAMPSAFRQLSEIRDRLEAHYRDMQDIEFTIEDGCLYMLQTRTGKRTAAAAVKIAVDMVAEGMIDQDMAVARIDPQQLDQLMHPMIDPGASYQALTTGLNASPGAAVGKVVFDADTAERLGGQGEKVILVRWETTPDDIHGVVHAQGVITSHGGMTSHAAVVARGMGKPCIAGASEVHIDADTKVFKVDGYEVLIEEGDWITMDGTTGEVIRGRVPLVPPRINENFQQILGWADECRRMRVRTNADTPEDAQRAREFGAEGIGLCRTEHMFMQEGRLPHVRNMILASSTQERERHLDKLLPFQREDFDGIFRAMQGLPVTIRLLDPPLHEFLPDYTGLMVEIERMRLTEAPAKELQGRQALAAKIKTLNEMNPMLGTRGCRLGIVYPEIYAMQARAIMEAACDVRTDTGEAPLVEIMIPLVGFAKELEVTRALVVETVDAVLREREMDISYLVGTMIELPRAALTADQIAEYADFFSFGTNDLTQTTLGFSRDDAEGKFLTYYLQEGILEHNPFERLDQNGVGALIAIAAQKSREVKEGIKLGICGEHGGEPSSITFVDGLGLDYVSCSPFRVPVARLAAAQATLAQSGVDGGPKGE